MRNKSGAVATEACQQKGTAHTIQTRKYKKGSDRGTGWRTIGAARRYGDGLRFAVVGGPAAGDYGVGADYAETLLLEGLSVPLYDVSRGEPVPVGEAGWSQNGRMIVLDLPQSGGRRGAVQVSGQHICAHYLRGDRESVPVVAPPDPVEVGGITA